MANRRNPDPHTTVVGWLRQPWSRSTAATPTPQGQASLRLLYLGRVYAAWIRILSFIPVVIVGSLAPTRATALSTAAVLALVSIATLLYLAGLFRGFPDWIALIDAGALAVLALSTPITIPPEWLAGGKSWLVPLLTTACVGYQYQLKWPMAGALAIGVHVALLIGAIAAHPENAPPFAFITVCWSLVIALLARMLWSLVRRGGRIADAAMAETEKVRTAQHVASAVRADERTLTNTLHDTAATTLLMVGLGQAHGHHTTLRRQARRDLTVLRTFGERLPDQLDLGLLIRAVADLVPRSIGLECPADLHVPSRAASVIADATAEAVHNAVRHAKADSITVRVSTESDDPLAILVVVTDSGVGFDPLRVPEARHGVRDSIRGRMAEIGGTATVASAIGAGTTIRLRWHRD